MKDSLAELVVMTSELTLRMTSSTLRIRSDSVGEILSGLKTSFAGRYIPSLTITEGGSGDPDAVIDWMSAREGFRVDEIKTDCYPEYYRVTSAPPLPYINEAPYFFILQVLSRLSTRRSQIVFTDTVSFIDDKGKAVMLMGYPHTGKSTLTAIALSKGYIPLTTENTVVDTSGGDPTIVGGTGILVYDPAIRELYGVNTPIHEKTRHGYLVVDLDEVVPERREYLERGVVIDRLYVLHCSFSSKGSDYKLIKGRKIAKTLWYFATALVKGVDYYEPYPLDLATTEVMKPIGRAIKNMSVKYEGRFYEVFGRHDKVFEIIVEMK